MVVPEIWYFICALFSRVSAVCTAADIRPGRDPATTIGSPEGVPRLRSAMAVTDPGEKEIKRPGGLVGKPPGSLLLSFRFAGDSGKSRLARCSRCCCVLSLLLHHCMPDIILLVAGGIAGLHVVLERIERLATIGPLHGAVIALDDGEIANRLVSGSSHG